MLRALVRGRGTEDDSGVAVMGATYSTILVILQVKSRVKRASFYMPRRARNAYSFGRLDRRSRHILSMGRVNRRFSHFVFQLF